MTHKLSRYILPSVISMVLVSAYTNIDGLFIGNVAGDDGIAAINIVWPVVAFITSLGTGIGVGGSIIISERRGRSEFEKAGAARFTTLLLLTVAGIAATLLLFFLHPFLLKAMGADGRGLEYAENYAFVVSLGSLFQIMGAGLVVLLRCDGKTGFAMLYTAVGLAVHILLDILLVREYALYGVAFATVAAQAVVMVAGLATLRIGRSTKIRFALAKDILRSALAPFGINFVASLVLLFTNYFALQYGGTAAVSAYGVMSYAVYTFDYIFQGVCDGIQPIVSFCFGAGDVQQAKRTLRSAVIILAVLAAAFVLLTPLMIWGLPKIFSASAETAGFMHSGLIIYAFSYPCKAAVKLICSYFYSKKKLWQANMLTYIEPLLLAPLLLAVLPLWVGLNGIWLALPVSQAIVAAVGILLLALSRGNNGGKKA